MPNLKALRQELKALVSRGHGSSLKAKELRAMIARISPTRGDMLRPLTTRR